MRHLDTGDGREQLTAPGRRVAHGWQRRPVRIAAALAAPVLAAVAFGLAIPRGPMSAAAGLASVGTGLVAGLLAGLAWRSRWAMLAAPVAFAVVFELMRRGTDGPTVDGIHTSTYGLMALAVGRGVHGVLVLVPMALGAALGAGFARHRAGLGSSGPWSMVRRAGAGFVGAGLVALCVAVARPASTDPILGPDGRPLAGSVAELTRVEVGGEDLALMIRGHSVANPVLLYLAGGPGGSELGAMRRHLASLERDFVVATWDQRGTGKSYPALDPTSTVTLERDVDDAIAVSEALRTRFGKERIVLVGQSWGSILGVLAARRRPDLYSAFVGTGQMVSPVETDRIFYEDTLAWARTGGKDDLVSTLTDIGPPPYASILDYEPALSYEHEVYPYDHSANSEGEGGFSENIFVEEYTLLERVHNLGAFLDTFSVLYPRIQGVDLRTQAATLDVPVVLVQGRHEARGRAEPAAEWFEALRAPRKRLITLETSGHRPLFEQPARFREAMRDVVGPLARGAER